MNPFFAYLDPGSGSLILQALVGGFSGMVVLGRYLWICLLYTSPSPRDLSTSRMPSSA